MSKNIYCISGLGADEKAFSKLQIPNYNLVFVQWLSPQRGEAIEVYAKRMCEQIGEENPILMGLSFGGIMCVEISKIIKTQKIILLSTIKTKFELPLWMKLVSKTKLYKIYSMKSYKITKPIQNYFIGAVNKEEKLMVDAYRKKADTNYVKWAVAEILNWKNENIPLNFIHLHGSADAMFPATNIKDKIVIKQGKHLMVITKANEVSQKIIEFLNKE